MSTKTLCATLLAVLLCAAVSPAANLTPWGDCETGGPDGRPAQFWHRAGGDYLSAWPDWKLTQDQKAAGRQSVTTDTDRAFVVCGETEGGWITGRVWLRAEKPGVKVVVRLSWWDRLKRADTVETVEAGPEWKQHTLKAEALRGEPVEIAVRAEKPGVRIWADSFTIEGAPAADQFTDRVYIYGKGEPEERTSQIGVVKARPVDLARLQAYAGQAADTQGRAALSVDVPANAAELPCVTGGVPFPRGALFRRERARLVDDAGREAPAQFDVLSRWPADGSIMILLVTTPTPEKSGRLWLEFGPAVQAAPVASPLDPRAPEKLPLPAPRILGADGKAIEPTGQAARAELAGPLRSVWSVEGRLEKAGRCVTRVIAWRGSRRYYVASQWLNDEKSPSIPVQAACLPGFPAPAALQPSLLTQAALDQEFFTSADAVARPPAGDPKRGNGLFGGSLAVRDFWRNHPMTVEAKPGAFAVWLWPQTVQGVLIPQGFGKQWEFLVDPDGRLTQPLLTETMPLLRADAQWMCDSGVFEFIMPPDPARFPIFEQRVGSAKTLGNFALEAKESRNLFGVFNFGDGPGDGGWANLESMADHELFLHWMRTGSREHFDMARLAAEHYRDIDIHHGAGFAHTHCNNHVASNESWSHAWIQGVRDLYFLTGDLAALEVLAQMGERLLAKPAGFTAGRDWTRPLDNLVDIYGATGDGRFLNALQAQLAELKRRQLPANAVAGAERFSWYEDRYAAGCAFTWYGCQAMAKLHLLAGGADLLDTLRVEIDQTLDVQTKSVRSMIILPTDKLTEDHRAVELGVFALGRGSTLFPPLGYLAGATGDKKYLDLGMKVLAHYMLSQRGGGDASAMAYATVFLRYARQAGLGAAEEAAAFQRARDFSYERWPQGVANGGFEEDHFAHWGVKKAPGKDSYYDNLVKVGYFLDNKVFRSGKRSLRLQSDNRLRVMSVAGSFGLAPTRQYRASLWQRADDTMKPTWSLSLREYDTDQRSSVALKPTGRVDRGWAEVAGEFITATRTVATFSLGNRGGTGGAWFDDVAIEDKGPALALLTANGLGRDWDKKPPYPAVTLNTGGSYVADKPMSTDTEKEGEPILFTNGCLTDGVTGGDYRQKPRGSYAYWQSRDTGSLLFDLAKPRPVRRVRVNIIKDDARKAHGVQRIELRLDSATGKLLAAIDPASNGWNDFDGLAVDAQRLALVFTREKDRSHITITEVEIWGEAPAPRKD